MIREVLALEVVAKAAKISSMVDSCGKKRKNVGTFFSVLPIIYCSRLMTFEMLRKSQPSLILSLKCFESNKNGPGFHFGFVFNK